MKTLKVLAVFFAALLICAVVWSGDEKPWFDLETCAFCKNFNLGNGNTVVDHMKGHYHHMPNGILAIMTIEEDYKDEFANAEAGMKKVIEEMQKTGTPPQMCGHCTTYGELVLGGVVEAQYNSEVAMAFTMTSDNPEMVKKLHAFGDKNNEEMAKWAADKAKAMEARSGK